MLILIFWGYVPGVVCYGVLVYDWRMWSFVHSYHCLQDQASLFVQRYNQLFFFFFFFLAISTYGLLMLCLLHGQAVRT